MKKIIFLLAMIPFLAFSQTPLIENAITVVGSANKEIEPDWIILGMSAKETENIKKESEIVTMELSISNFIKSIGLPSNSFSIDRFSANTQYGFSNSKYNLSKSYKLKIDKVGLIDTIVAFCFNSGMDNIYVNQIGHSKIDSIQNEVLNDALKFAIDKASIIAKTMNLRLGNVISVNETFHLVNNNLGSYNYDDYRLESIVAVGYGTQNKGKVSSNLSFQKIQINKTIIVKYGIE